MCWLDIPAEGLDSTGVIALDNISQVLAPFNLNLTRDDPKFLIDTNLSLSVFTVVRSSSSERGAGIKHSRSNIVYVRRNDTGHSELYQNKQVTH